MPEKTDSFVSYIVLYFAKATNSTVFLFHNCPFLSLSPPFCHGIRSCRKKSKGKAKNADAGHGGALVGYSTVPAPGLLQRVMKGSPSFLRDMARYFKSGEGALLGKDYPLQVLCEWHQLSCRRCSAISRGLQYHIYKLVFPSPLTVDTLGQSRRCRSSTVPSRWHCCPHPGAGGSRGVWAPSSFRISKVSNLCIF